MKALDANVLVRFLTVDDERQARRAHALLERAEADGRPLFVADVVLLELIWVLSAVYEYERGEVRSALEAMAQMPALKFEDADRLHRVIDQGRRGPAGLADLLIGLTARSRGCGSTLTFDRAAGKSELFEMIG